MERRITDDIFELKQVLPEHLQHALDHIGNTDDLIEIVLDLGRFPTARYVEGEIVLLNEEVTRDDLDTVVLNIGDFDGDNRAGMERTLHRISGIRNRRGDVVGLTCRVGRAVYGTIDIIQDLIESGQNVLMMGPPGVGKTTMLRESARVLAESKRVVIVDTSNEIGGDGDVPHPAVGRARRMQVSQPERQHEVMIEAVENHNPQVIVIDEIGRELEAMAARTIAERGVQLIGTAHGNALENLMLNPTLSDLVGGIESVTLSDEEARRRGTQKSVLERRAPPTFDILIELQNRDKLIVHEDVAAAVDMHLRGRGLPVELRSRNAEGEIEIEAMIREPLPTGARSMGKDAHADPGAATAKRKPNAAAAALNHSAPAPAPAPSNGHSHSKTTSAVKAPEVLPENYNPVQPSRPKQAKLFVHGVARDRLRQSAKRLHVAVAIVEDVEEADAILTIKNLYRSRPRLIVDAERRGMPIYVLRASTVSQIESFLIDLFELQDVQAEPDYDDAMDEARRAIVQVRDGETFIDLAPQVADVRRLQHEMIREFGLNTESFGDEPMRFVRVLGG